VISSFEKQFILLLFSKLTISAFYFDEYFYRTSAFKIPSRVAMSDTKRQTWFDELAKPTVPLNKLGKSVPHVHGAKGHDLLDLLYSKNVAIPRAVWFLRVFGANETVSANIYISTALFM